MFLSCEVVFRLEVTFQGEPHEKMDVLKGSFEVSLMTLTTTSTDGLQALTH